MYFSRCRQHLSTKIVCREKLHIDKAFKNVTYVYEDGAQYKLNYDIVDTYEIVSILCIATYL